MPFIFNLLSKFNQKNKAGYFAENVSRSYREKLVRLGPQASQTGNNERHRGVHRILNKAN